MSRRRMLQLLRIGVCVLGLMTLQRTVFGQTGTHDGFELVKHQDDILVYERWVTFPQSDPPVTAREVKSEFYIKSKIQHALSLIRDESRIADWQKHVSEFKVYLDTDSVWHEYSYHDIPWPVSDQDHFLEYTIEDPVEQNAIYITFRTVDNQQRAPERNNVSRMTLSGSWLFECQREGTIKVTYRILSMPGTLPRFITDPVIRNNLMSTVRAYIDLLEKGYK